MLICTYNKSDSVGTKLKSTKWGCDGVNKKTVDKSNINHVEYIFF